MNWTHDSHLMAFFDLPTFQNLAIYNHNLHYNTCVPYIEIYYRFNTI